MKDRGRNTRLAAAPASVVAHPAPSLHVFEGDSDASVIEWVVAYSPEDAAALMRAECGASGDPESYDSPGYWTQVPDRCVFAIQQTEDPNGPKTAKTCARWALSNGRGFLCASEG